MIGVGHFDLSPNTRKYIKQVLDSRRISYGPFTQKFERLFASAHSSKFAIMTNSGTSSLLVAISILKNKFGWNDGDEVLVPAVTFIATSNVVIQAGLKPVFVDVDPIFYEINPEKISEKITEKTKCIIPVHLFGCPCDMDPILEIAKKHNLKIIEDSCEAMFVNYKGRSVGSFGEVGCFSTYVAHLLTTGVGGICTTNSDDMAVNIRSMVNHGRDSIYISIDDDAEKTDEELKMIIGKRFSFVQMGHSFRITEFEGALGLAEFENKDLMMAKRFENATFFMNSLARFSDKMQLPSIRAQSGHAFMMFPIVLKNKLKNKLVEHLEKNGIETREMLPITNQPYYKEKLKIKEDEYPVAKWINESGFYIGCHHGISIAERDYIVEMFESYFSKKSSGEMPKTTLILMAKLSEVKEEAIKDILNRIPKHLFEEIVVCNNSSNKELSEIFTENNIKEIKGPKGKGEIFKKALKDVKTKYAIVMGLDGSDRPSDITRIIIELKRGAELVVASRFTHESKRESGREFSYRSIGNRFFTFLLSAIYGKNITDSNNLFRGFNINAIEKLNLQQSGNAIFYEMPLMALKNEIKTSECPTDELRSIIKAPKSNRFLMAITFSTLIFNNLFNPFYKKKK